MKMVNTSKKSNPFWFIALLWVAVWLFSACNTKPQTSTSNGTPNTNPPPAADTITNGSLLTQQQAKTIIEQYALNALRALTANNTTLLAGLVHPQKGVRFSPYAFVNTDTDMVFLQQHVAKLANEVQKYTWGTFDGSGEPITLTYNEYRKKFVTDKDYLNKADSVGYNQIIGRGNSVNNREKVYSKAIIVEYYQSGKNPDFGGMDWGSLALAFEKYNGQWFLTGIIHNGWTI
ncbi:hypothetical protein C7N43_01085 [Sphingobacteriales bacterium UPWRP_1]|nr:hypothetical protein B6N25_14465 [Sphingobacteriales bacterium TSM_CSS]PSJ78907.1 hypothetical protein C7N43_01085 [Sphingobacteriales bacterium UPWRP_1]